MEAFMEKVAEINGAVNSFIWGAPGLILIIGAGILLTIFTKVFQITRLKQWWTATVGTMFRKKEKADSRHLSRNSANERLFRRYAPSGYSGHFRLQS